jgi:hypothetical protein
MERVIEIFFDQFLKEIVGEGERRLKLQAFSACLGAIRGVRRLFLVVYFLCFACFLSALSFFATALCAFEQWRAESPDWHEPRLLFSLVLFAFSTGILALTVREKKWSGAFRLQERIADLEYESASQSSGLREEDLVRVINRVLDERLKPDSEKVA